MIEYVIASILAVDILALAMLTADTMPRARKPWWAFVIVIIPIAGMLLYLILGRVGQRQPPPNRLAPLSASPGRFAPRPVLEHAEIEQQKQYNK